MKYLIYQQGTSYNHGCEALLRTTIKFLRSLDDTSSIMVLTNDLNSEKKMGIEGCDFFQSDFILKKFSFKWFALQFSKIFKSKKLRCYAVVDKKLKELIKQCDAAIAIGGDNYCYNDGRALYDTDSYIKSHGLKMILLGCSIEPSSLQINKSLVKNLQQFDLITARESITFNALIDAGINRVELIPDAAFTLSVQKYDLPQIFDKEVVAINFSPMSLSYVKHSGILLDSYVKLVEHILNNTDYNILFLPHVIVNTTDDRDTMMPIFKKFKYTNRVGIIDDSNANCMQLKYLISKSKMLVAARTHASIAAYSTCVPTLVLGYSVKSKGIALDLFGDYKNYVLPVQDIENSSELIDRFDWMNNNYDTILQKLQNKIPAYVKSALNVIDVLKTKVLDNNY